MKIDSDNGDIIFGYAGEEAIVTKLECCIMEHMSIDSTTTLLKLINNCDTIATTECMSKQLRNNIVRTSNLNH